MRVCIFAPVSVYACDLLLCAGDCVRLSRVRDCHLPECVEPGKQGNIHPRMCCLIDIII